MLLRFLKVLADETRLRIVGLLAAQERSVEELAAALELRAPTISHHLSKLREVELVTMRAEKNTHIYALNLERLRHFHRDLAAPERMAALTARATPEPESAWERKVLNDFLSGERLKEIPASLKKRKIVLRWLVEQFESDRTYSEAEVNAILRRHHEDVAFLRREFIGEHLMARENGQYWRVAPADEDAHTPSSAQARDEPE